MLIVFVTAPDTEEAERLATAIIDAGLAACVQVLPEMTSFYVWKGEMQKDGENLLLIKTLEEKFGDLEKFIKSNHSYEIPEIVGIRVERVSDGYLDWIREILE